MGIILLEAWSNNGSDSLWETPWGLKAVKLKNDHWVVNLVRAGATFYYTSTEWPSKMVLQLVDKMEVFKIKPPILSNVALWPGSLESQTLVSTLGSSGVFKPWYFLLTLPLRQFPHHTERWVGGRFFEIMKPTFTGPLYYSVKWCHQRDKMISKAPSVLTQTMLWFWLSLSVRLSLIFWRHLKEYISYYLETDHYNSLQTHVSFMWCTICKCHLGPILFFVGSEVCQRDLSPNPQRARTQTKVREI